MIPNSIKKLVDFFTRLPSLGPRQAIRLAFYLANWTKNDLREFGESLKMLENLKICPNCNFPHENKDEICNICSDPNRQKNIIALVEKTTDLITLEQSKNFWGTYFVVHDFKKGQSNLQNLKTRIEKDLGGQIEEIILAISPTTYGDINADIMINELKNHAKKITRLGRGIPTGGEIEFADEDTIKSAFDNRK